MDDDIRNIRDHERAERQSMSVVPAERGRSFEKLQLDGIDIVLMDIRCRE